MANDVDITKRIVKLNHNVEAIKELSKSLDTTPFSWLNGRNYSDAFVICVGAGPWKFQRRKTIQKLALDKLSGRDLSNLDSIDWYPLEWQNNFVNNMIFYLKDNNYTMEKFCSSISSRYQIYKAVNGISYKGSKVLSLFCRDALKIPAFPIDRHVRRLLLHRNLPDNEEDMINLCNLAKLNANKMAVGMVRMASDMDNPDWSLNK